MRILYVNPSVRFPQSRESIAERLARLLPQHTFETLDTTPLNLVERFETARDRAQLVVYEIGFRPEYLAAFQLLSVSPGVVLLVDDLPSALRTQGASPASPGRATESELESLLVRMGSDGYSPSMTVDSGRHQNDQALAAALVSTIVRRATALGSLNLAITTLASDSWALPVLVQWLPSVAAAPVSSARNQGDHSRVSFIHRHFRESSLLGAQCNLSDGSFQCVQMPEQVDEWAATLQAVKGSRLAIFAQAPRSFEEAMAILDLQQSGTICLVLPRMPQRRVSELQGDPGLALLVHAKASALAAHSNSGPLGSAWVEREYAPRAERLDATNWAAGLDGLFRRAMGQTVALEAATEIRPSLRGASPHAASLASELLSGMFEA